MTDIIDDLKDLRKIDLPFDLDEVLPQCHECVRNQLKKYDNFIHDGQSCHNRFFVPCTGIKKNIVSYLEESTHTDIQLEMIKASRDNVEFAKAFARLPGNLPWEARWYQENVLRCTSLRKVLRIGRRSGKTDSVCMDILYKLFTNKDRKIFVTGPQKIHVEEIFIRLMKFISSHPFLSDSVIRDRKAPYYEIQLRNGSRVRGVPAGAKGKKDGLGGRGQDADDIYCFPKGTLVNTSKFGVKPIETLTLQDTVLGGNQNGIYTGDIQNLGVRKGTLITIPTVLNMIKCTPEHPLFNGKEDIQAKDATEVIVSLYHKQLTFGYKVVIARLLGMLYGDGWISNGTVGFSGQPDDLEQVQIDLMSLGDKKHSIYARVTENKEKNIKGFGAQITSSYIYNFFKDLHPEGKKVFQPLRVPDMIKNGTIYIKTSFLSGLFSAESTGVKYQKNNKTPRTLEFNMRSQELPNLLNWFDDVKNLLNEMNIKYSFKYKQLVDEDRWVGYISVSNSKENIDLFVEKIGFCYSAKKTKLANIWKLYRHYEKTWKSDCWAKNRKLCSCKKNKLNTRIVSSSLGIPISTVKYHYNRHHELYSEKFLTVDEYINKITWSDGYVLLPIIRENIRYSNELVDVYNLTSGAANRFFAGGFFTHNCEEMDYIDESALRGAIFPILFTTATTSLCGFSTPSGFKTPYYNLCLESPAYKEFHYTYKVLPHWRLVETERDQFTEEEWKHEYLAEFGTAESGVYQPAYIERALTKYDYTSMVRNPSWKYTIGTDWNEKFGTEIVVLGFNPFLNTYHVVDAVHIERSEFTQLAGVDAVLKMNQKWMPNYIYIDSGNGSTNYELLRKTAWKQSHKDGNKVTANLLKILVKYDSGASLEIKDPITHQVIKKPAKPFMVSACVRLFEQNLIRISNADERLKKQLGNYLIDRISPNGTTIYGVESPKIGDHRLDALHLAAVAFHLHYSDLHKTVINMQFGGVPDARSGVARNAPEENQQSKRCTIQERRLDTDESSTLLGKHLVQRIPGRLSSQSQEIQTNRLGWATDREAEEMLKYQQRQNKKRKLRTDRPSRTNI